jgi:chemotaxis protein MotA
MNYLSVVSFLLAAAVFLFSVLTSSDNPKAMVDPHGALIVFGGSIAATAIAFQLDRVLLMLKVFWIRTILGKRPDYVAIIRNLMKIAEAYRNDNKAETLKLAEGANDPFLLESITGLLDEMVEPDHLYHIQKRRITTIFQRYYADAKRFKSMGKFPPAMGLMGAVLGMIALLGSLGRPGAEKGVGPAMSIALVATFYGIALANLIIIPIGENLGEAAEELKIKNTIILEGVRLVAARTNPIVLAEELNSYLLPNERLDWKNLT